MTIRAQSADGQLHEFPDGTDGAVIDRVMKEYAQSKMLGSGTGRASTDAGRVATIANGDCACTTHVPLVSTGSR